VNITLESEWNKLTKNLTADDMKDGRRCFMAGALTVLAELPRLYPIDALPRSFLKKQFGLTHLQISEWDQEITNAMEKDACPERTR
jgi:hypothetical protein